MRRVADHLARMARDKIGSELDVFARSAFNRYYYSAYTRTACMLDEVAEKAGTRAVGDERDYRHSQLPAMLIGKLRVRLKDKVNNLIRRGGIPNGDGLRLRSSIEQSLRMLAGCLEDAYKVRVIADYKSQYVAEEKDGAIILHGTKLSSAPYWVETSEVACRALESALEEIYE